CDAVVRRREWEVPRIFIEIQRAGEVSDAEMARVFNLGVGMVVVVPQSDVFRALDVLRAKGHFAAAIGEVVEGRGQVRLEP
ncbi:MAG: phosphoribosylformylglycinamidine cyclo-ligase, partial [Actinobacteria bacterium]|nr:phosphoribosylformylglycinamidine cyclo-ligase [Actinomycetota bacterium]